MVEETEIAQLILDGVPLVMMALRSKFRVAAKSELTVPQWRLLAHLNRGVSDATALAEIQGVSLPAISRMVDGLVERGLIIRSAKESDRRQASVGLTPAGKLLYQKARREVQDKIKTRLTDLEPDSRKKLFDGMKVLLKVFDA